MINVCGLVITCFFLMVNPVFAQTQSAEKTDVDSSDTHSELPQGLAQELSQLKPQKESAGSKSQSGYLDMAMGLMAVLAVIVALAWLAKRFNVSGMSMSQSLKMQSVLSLGSKEKVMIVKVEGRRFLLGVTPHQISILSELDSDGKESAGDLSPETPSFAQQIKYALKQGKLGEDSKAS